MGGTTDPYVSGRVRLLSSPVSLRPVGGRERQSRRGRLYPFPIECRRSGPLSLPDLSSTLGHPGRVSGGRSLRCEATPPSQHLVRVRRGRHGEGVLGLVSLYQEQNPLTQNLTHKGWIDIYRVFIGPQVRWHGLPSPVREVYTYRPFPESS